VADDGVHGWELWRSKGASTVLVKDIFTGSIGSNPRLLTSFKDALFFQGNDGIQAHGVEFWKSDGTAAGTVRVTSFPPSTPPNGIDHFGESAVPAGALFSFADPVTGKELWRTDGTAAGTERVRDINDANGAGSFPYDLFAFGGKLVFYADDGLDLRGLWTSDGTAEGTVFVSHVNGAIGGGGKAQEAGGLLFLSLAEPSAGDALWRTDGTAAGTIRLTPPGFGPSSTLQAVGSTVYFDTNVTGLWKSDGTPAGTMRVQSATASFTFPGELVSFHGRLFFTAQGEGSRLLWSSDGTPSGTVPVREIDPADSGARVGMIEHAGRLWFFGRDPEHGTELWSSDGTAAGTGLAVEIVPGPDGFSPRALFAAAGRLFLDGTTADQTGLWASDDTPAGTRWIGPVGFGPETRPAVFHDELYYPGWDDTLWRSDGTEAGTRQVHDRDGQPVQRAVAPQVLGDRLYWTDPTGRLWESDGTEAGTAPVQDPPDLRAEGALARAGQRLFFAGRDLATGTELWALGPP